MNRWAVDTAGTDVEADLRLEENKRVFLPGSNKSTGRKHQDPESQAYHNDNPDELGDIYIPTAEELYDAYEARLVSESEPREPTSAFSETQRSRSQRCSVGPVSSGTFNKEQSVLSDVSMSMSMDLSPKAKEIKVYENFTNPNEQSTMTTLQMKQINFCNIDIVSAFLKQVFAQDPSLSEKFSNNPRHYKLFIADEFTGEAEMAVMLDKVAQGFFCYALQALPQAKQYLFPQRTELLPTTAHDINITVTIRPQGQNVNPIQRMCCVAADMLVESLESVIISRLPANSIVQGSLRVKYGPIELNINEIYNFGAGCGAMNCPISEYTLLSLYRFGATEVVVSGRVVEESNGSYVEAAEDIVIDMSVEEALTFQQFEVICINRYGARQQRLFCVEGEHIYTMRPNTDDVANTTEKLTKEIEDVVTYPGKPKYLEIVYTRASKFEPDHIECTTIYNRALIEEKIRVIRRELRKRAEEAEAEKEKVSQKRFGRFFKGWF